MELGRAEGGPSVSTARCPLSCSHPVVLWGCSRSCSVQVITAETRSLSEHRGWVQVSSCDLLNSVLTRGEEVFEGKREFFGLLSGK